jgi:hypothetical protein
MVPDLPTGAISGKNDLSLCRSPQEIKSGLKFHEQGRSGGDHARRERQGQLVRAMKLNLAWLIRTAGRRVLPQAENVLQHTADDGGAPQGFSNMPVCVGRWANQSGFSSCSGG